METVLEPAKESLHYKSSFAVTTLQVFWHDKFGVAPVWNTAANAYTPEIISAVFPNMTSLSN